MNSGNRDGPSESRWGAWSIGSGLKSVIGAKPIHKTRNALSQLDARRKAEIARGACDIGIGLVDVARRPILVADLGLAAGGLLDNTDQTHDVFRMAVAQIVDAMRCALTGFERCLDDPHQRSDD